MQVLEQDFLFCHPEPTVEIGNPLTSQKICKPAQNPFPRYATPIDMESVIPDPYDSIVQNAQLSDLLHILSTMLPICIAEEYLLPSCL